MTPTRFADSEISGSEVVCTSPKLIAAYHVLHRFRTPRHPPYALISLTKNSANNENLFPLLCMGSKMLAFLSPMQLSKSEFYIFSRHGCRKKHLVFAGGDNGDRTRNLRLAEPALSQLSYIPSGLPTLRWWA